MVEELLKTDNVERVNAIEPQDKILAPDTKQEFVAPQGDYYIAITNEDESDIAKYKIYYRTDDKRSGGNIEPGKTLYISTTETHYVIENVTSIKSSSGPKISIRFYYRTNFENENTYLDLPYGESYTYYNSPGDYLIFSKLYSGVLLEKDWYMNLQICDEIDRCGFHFVRAHESLIFPVEMSYAGIRVRTKSKSGSGVKGVNIWWYQHIK